MQVRPVDYNALLIQPVQDIGMMETEKVFGAHGYDCRLGMEALQKSFCTRGAPPVMGNE